MTEGKKDLMDRIRSNFSDLERTHFYVEEWDQDIYMTPMTVNDRKEIHKRSKNSPLEIGIYGLIRKAEDEKGDKLFTLDDKVSLINNITYETLETIINALLIKDESPEQAEKNLEGI